MRLFVRLEDTRIITLWLPESSDVGHAKQCIVESGRSMIATTYKDFRLISGLGLEMKNDDKVEEYTLVGDSQRVYACLKLRKTAMDICNSFETIFPSANTTVSASPSAITVGFVETTDLMQNYEIYMRTDRSEIVEGTMSWEGKKLLFTPVQSLQYNRSYVVHVDSESGDFEWLFSIAALPSLRLFVKCVHRGLSVSNDHHESDARDRSSLINIPRQSPALYTELLQLIAKRFNVEVQTIWKLVATTSEGAMHEVRSDRDVGELNEFYCLVVSVDTNIPSPPVPPTGITHSYTHPPTHPYILSHTPNNTPYNIPNYHSY